MVANENAIQADIVFRGLRRHPWRYELQMSHNHHMLAYASMMNGESQKASNAVSTLLSEIPEDFIDKSCGEVDGTFGMRFELQIRFGQWDAILANPKPRISFPIATALWGYARAVAYAAKKELKEASAEENSFRADKEVAIRRGAAFRTVPAAELLGVAEKMLSGEILYREGRTAEGIDSLAESVRREDKLPFTEPPVWILPVRHVLGATLIDAGRYRDAETVYREDLIKNPDNGWSLFGLAQSLRLQGRATEAAAASRRFEKSWRFSDVRLSSSCFCLKHLE